MKTNTPVVHVAKTHEGGTADPHQKPYQELERALSTCLLWENTFYQKGSEIAQRIAGLCAQVSIQELAALAIRARTDLKLRHVPLFLVRQMVKLHKGSLVGDTLAEVIKRPDEMAEFLSLYWKDRPAGKHSPKLSAQVKRGLAKAFQKFNAYQLAKWNRDGAVKLRDVLFLCHAKPRDAEQDALWKSLIAGTLESPDTWEVALSSGADKHEVWTRLLIEKKLGYMALLQNLRNMAEAKVETGLVEEALRTGASKSWALPFRFIAAAKHAPAYANALSEAMCLALTVRNLPGKTGVLIDVSGSMDAKLSAKSTLSYWEAGAALGILFREIATSCRVFTFSNQLIEVANYRGLPLIEAVRQSQPHGGTYLSGALTALHKVAPELDRLVIITDEQSHDGIYPAWMPHAYLINVASNKPALETHQGWQRISGWSERVVDWMILTETGTVEEEDE